MADTILALALRQIGAHAMVKNVSEVTVEGGLTSVWFDLDLDFGARWAAEGHSPTGVHPVEKVRFDFPPSFPARAPEPSYRPELGRNFPHVQPWTTSDGRPVPCLTEGSRDEFIAAFGLTAFVDQFWLWMRRAAGAGLIDDEQGWEPTRRDGWKDDIVLDRAALRALPDDKALGPQGYTFLQTTYVATGATETDPGRWVGEIFKPAKLSRTYQQTTWPNGHVGGTGMALALWATSSSGATPVFGTYEPEDVTNYKGLLAKADRLKVLYKLRKRIKELEDIKWKGAKATVPLIVVFLVRRPFRIIGEDSAIEILPYVLPVSFPGGKPVSNDSVVKPLTPRDRIEIGLLQRLSGTQTLPTEWIALGAGSLGSKIAMHLTRAGHPPLSVVDRAMLQPHNVARHALYPRKSGAQFGWYGAKADVLAETLAAMSKTEVASDDIDIRDSVAPIEKRLEEKGPSLILNTTASLIVRDVLAAASGIKSRVVDAELHHAGRLGLMRTEGPDRNPDVAELTSALYEHARTTPALRELLFDEAPDLSHVSVGEGCGSLTMVMQDATLSLHAAAMSLKTEGVLAAPPDQGRIEVWHSDGTQLLHHGVEVAPFIRVDLTDGWTLTLSAEVDAAISADIAKHPKVESGGIIMGRFSQIARSIQVVGLVKAPPDSIRRADYFELGIKGVQEAFEAYSSAAGGTLYCVGTWHSHLGKATPSAKDRATAVKLANSTPYPLALLISGTDGYQAVFAGPET